LKRLVETSLAWRVGLCLALLVSQSAKGQLHLEVEAPEELAPESRRVEALEATKMGPFLDLLGLDEPGPPIRVVLVPEGSDLADRVPAWIAGFAQGQESLVVLFPGRVPTYPYSSLPELVRHEAAHVLIDRAGGGAALPRWFHEGLAMTAEGSWRMADRSRLAMAMLRSREPSVDELTALFGGDEQRIAWAYAVSGALVRDLLRHSDGQAIAELLENVRMGMEFDQAFLASFRETPASSLANFWRRSALWYRWLPFLTSSSVLWIAVTLLALLAVRRRRERDRKIREMWDAEEALETIDVEDLVN
jgi:hypothetical protein